MLQTIRNLTYEMFNNFCTLTQGKGYIQNIKSNTENFTHEDTP